MIIAPELPSAKPYLIRALYEWCADQGFTPFLSVFVDENVRVPQNFVRDGEITLNIGAEATGGLIINNELIEFNARFNMVPHHIVVPITHVMAIYARDTGQGMAFPIADEPQEVVPRLPNRAATLPSKLTANPTNALAKKHGTPPAESPTKKHSALKVIKSSSSAERVKSRTTSAKPTLKVVK